MNSVNLLRNSGAETWRPLRPFNRLKSHKVQISLQKAVLTFDIRPRFIFRGTWTHYVTLFPGLLAHQIDTARSRLTPPFLHEPNTTPRLVCVTSGKMLAL